MEEDHKVNPKSFFKIVKAVSKLQPSVKIVTGFRVGKDELPLEQGLVEIVKELYCPAKTALSFKVVKAAKYYP